MKKERFKNINHVGFQNAIEFCPWENVFAVESVNDKVSVLENYMNDILDQYAPYKSFTVKKRNHTPWIGPKIREMMEIRDSFKNDFNTTGVRGDLLKGKCLMTLSTNQLVIPKTFMTPLENSES